MAPKNRRLHYPSQSDDAEGRRIRTRERSKVLTRTRSLIKKGVQLPENAVAGTVVTPLGPSWLVWTTGGYHVGIVSGTVDCPHSSTIVTVGDDVWLLPDGGHDVHGNPTSTIVRVEERRTLISRKAAGRARREQVLVANVDQLAIVVAAAQPDYNRRLIDRYLIAADKGDLEPMIVMNKIDIADEMSIRELIVEDMDAYRLLGVEVVYTSVNTLEGLDAVRKRFAGLRTIMAGPSGVGKSSLINALTDARLAVGEISSAYSKGKHTTTGSIAIPLPEGGALIDSPGIREFSIWELDKEELPFYFGEFEPYSPLCRFQPCTHIHEPGCAVQSAVDSGTIDPARYESYRILYDEVTTVPIAR